MSDPVLTLLVGIIAALVILGAVGGLVARGAREAVGFIGAGLGGLGFLLSLLSAILGPGTASLELRFGPPGLSLLLALDPLSAFYLMLLFLSGTAATAFAAEAEATAPPVSLAGVALCVAGLALTLLAADGITLALGIALAGGAIWASCEPGRSRAVQLGVALLAALAIMAAMALSGLTFEAIRAHPAAPPLIVYLLALAGSGALAGLVPFHQWLIPAHRAAPTRAATLLSGAVQPVAIYLMLRQLLDLGGPSIPLWWSLPLLALGGASVLIGGWRAVQQPEVDSCLAAMTCRQTGLAAIGLGLALVGRSADLPNMTVLAVTAVLLLSLAQAICGTLSQLAGGAVRHGAGSRRLALLGGLIHPMPLVTTGMAAGLYGQSALPAGAGFAALWLLFQAILAGPRSAGFPASVGVAVIAAVLALSAVLSAAAMVRLIGVAFLGRPRGPRAAGAIDIAKSARPGLLALVSISVLIGIFPGPVMKLLAGGAIPQLAGEGLGLRAGLLGLYPSVGAAGYLVVPLVALAALIAATMIFVLRRRGGAAPRFSPAWNDGFSPPPAWLPFGDPLTQAAGAGFVPELPKTPSLPALPLPVSLLTSLPNIRVRPSTGLWALLAAVAVLLAALAWMGGQ